MTQTNKEIVENYYKAMNNKDLESIAQVLHSEVEFIGPLAQMRGKEPFLKAVGAYFSVFDSLTIRAFFESRDQVMLAYDYHCPPPIETYRTAALINVKEGLITRFELFYDASLISERKEEIFSSSEG